MAETLSLPGAGSLPDVIDAMGLVEAELSEAVSTADPFISEMTSHLLKGGGKRIRPALALLGAKFGGEIGERAVDAGAAVELIHLGSLYHDDVIDESDTRRGMSSVNANWSNSVAILAGDYLLAMASEIGARLGREASELLARTLAALVTGELTELNNAYNVETSAEDYITVIENKTAALISASVRLGALVNGAPRSQVDDLTEYGRRIGIAFQIADDLLDITSTEERLGKPVGLDILEGTYTLPVIHGMRSPAADEIRELLSVLRPDNPAVSRLAARRVDAEAAHAIQRIRQLLYEYGSIEFAFSEAKENADQARLALKGLPVGPARDALETMGEFILSRVPLEDARTDSRM